MNHLVALPLAAVFAIGLTAGAQAFDVPPRDYRADLMETSVTSSPVLYHRCHGAGAGTSSVACGTATGGPVGGLH